MSSIFIKGSPGRQKNNTVTQKISAAMYKGNGSFFIFIGPPLLK
jgi:hypothetical protein